MQQKVMLIKSNIMAKKIKSTKKIKSKKKVEVKIEEEK